MRPVQFRLDEALLKELDKRAKDRRLSRADYLRDIVVDKITDRTQEETLARLVDLDREVAALRHKLAKATAAILIDMNKLRRELGKDAVSASEINAWVSKNIMP